MASWMGGPAAFWAAALQPQSGQRQCELQRQVPGRHPALGPDAAACSARAGAGRAGVRRASGVVWPRNEAAAQLAGPARPCPARTLRAPLLRLPPSPEAPEEHG